MVKKLYSILKKIQKPQIILLSIISFFLMVFAPIIHNVYLFYFVFSLVVFFILIPVILVFSIHFITFVKVISDKDKRNKLNNIHISNGHLSVRQLARQMKVSGYEAFFILDLASKGDKKMKQISKFNYQIID